MPTYSSDRRSLLKIIGAIGATCSYPFAGDELFAQTTSDAQVSRHNGHSTQTHYFNERDFKTISQIAELIIPETDTPGAIAAGVPAYIDRAVSMNTDFQLLVADGLRWLDGEAGRVGSDKSFLDLSDTQQFAILEPLCSAYDANEGRYVRNVQFFSLIKNLTADGYYTSELGLMQELGFRLEMLREYPSCPES